MVGELRASHVIHLHRLLSAVRAEFEENGMDDDRLADYRDHDVVPTDFKTTKVEHERALLTLSATLSEWAAEQRKATEPERTPETREGGDTDPDPDPDPAPEAEEPERAPEASASQ